MRAVKFLCAAMGVLIVLGGWCAQAAPATSASPPADKHSDAIVELLADNLVEPLSMGEYGKMRAQLVFVRKIDPSIAFLHLISVKGTPGGRGHVIASSDPTLRKGAHLEKTAQDRRALTAKTVMHQAISSSLFEVDAPVVFRKTIWAVLRVGFSPAPDSSGNAGLRSQELIAHLLAHLLVDPFSMGKYDRMQQILDHARKIDKEIDYAHLVSTDGRVISSTQLRTAKTVVLNQTDADKKALAVKGVAIQTMPDNVVEVDVPIGIRSQVLAILRLGVHRANHAP